MFLIFGHATSFPPRPPPRRLPIASLGEGRKAGGGGGKRGGGEEKTCLRLSMSTSATQNMASAFDRALRRGEQGDFVSAVFKKEPLAPRRGGGARPLRGCCRRRRGPGAAATRGSAAGLGSSLF